MKIKVSSLFYILIVSMILRVDYLFEIRIIYISDINKTTIIIETIITRLLICLFVIDFDHLLK